MKTKMNIPKFRDWKSDKFWLGKLLEHPEIMTQGETVDELEEKINKMKSEADIKKLETNPKTSGWTGCYMWTRFKQLCFAKGYLGGFTLLELIVTVAIMATLAAVAIPTYLKSQSDAQLRTSQANMINIKQAFINNFYYSVIDRGKKEFPAEPSDNQMTFNWANNTILYNGGTVSGLFSGGQIIYNPYNNPYLYKLIPLGSDPENTDGFVIEDPDIGIIMEFTP